MKETLKLDYARDLPQGLLTLKISIEKKVVRKLDKTQNLLLSSKVIAWHFYVPCCVWKLQNVGEEASAKSTNYVVAEKREKLQRLFKPQSWWKIR